MDIKKRNFNLLCRYIRWVFVAHPWRSQDTRAITYMWMLHLARTQLSDLCAILAHPPWRRNLCEKPQKLMWYDTNSCHIVKNQLQSCFFMIVWLEDSLLGRGSMHTWRRCQTTYLASSIRIPMTSLIILVIVENQVPVPHFDSWEHGSDCLFWNFLVRLLQWKGVRISKRSDNCVLARCSYIGMLYFHAMTHVSALLHSLMATNFLITPHITQCSKGVGL